MPIKIINTKPTTNSIGPMKESEEYPATTRGGAKLATNNKIFSLVITFTFIRAPSQPLSALYRKINLC
jgi:hypothetical protein